MKLLYMFLFIGLTIYGGEYVQDDLIVGINRFKGNKVYISSENGSAIIEIKSDEYYTYEIKSGSIQTISISGDMIRFKDKRSPKIYLHKGTPETIIKISLDGKKFSRYRGDFEFIPYKNSVLPLNSVQSEDYIYSVVPSEIGHYFPEEAIKAQSLAARSYLYYGLRYSKYDKFDLFDNVNSQMYLGMDRENQKINSSIDTTRGKVILYSGKPINALYYSTSGGITANNEDVWGGNVTPYLRSVNDRGNETKSPRLKWEVKISKNEISKRFGFKVKGLKVLEVKSNRVNKIKVYGNKNRTITGDKFRSIVGYGKVYSTQFRVRSSGNYFLFTGKGSGHGVGMSQYGAYGLSQKGKNYQEILKHYYKGVEIKEYKRTN
ncbi:SpoIID/LytB domain-containing protein [Psychrilyobacter atlanticus]|uniref:SpoIID/LytB domain-containing protein n=1 Tax=Psychrilyobacter atlanticus TaxID=271091 RepID=UPI000404753F|nr:SpoIID/LytB domain-containing protein [Psychrilyobacter atlanticus]